MDIAFLLDASTSVGINNFRRILNLTKALLSKADIDSGSVRVAAMTFSTETHINFHLHALTTKSGVFHAIDNIPYTYGSTNTADGLKVLREEIFLTSKGDRHGVPNQVFIITDGVSNMNAHRTVSEAMTTKENGVEIFAIGIAIDDTSELDQIVSEPRDNHRFTVDEFAQLEGLKESLFLTWCPG